MKNSLDWIDKYYNVSRKNKFIYIEVLNFIQDIDLRQKLAQCSCLETISKKKILVAFDKIVNYEKHQEQMTLIEDGFRSFYGLPVQITFYCIEELDQEMHETFLAS